jgi:hypothetical protein
MSLKVQVLKARKILVGSVGVATASFVGINCSRTSVANLMAPPSCEVAPNNPWCYDPDAGTDAAKDAAGGAGGAGGVGGGGGDRGGAGGAGGK